MKRHLITFFAILCCVTACVTVTKATSEIRMEFEIPFDFVVKGQTLSAGKYAIERFSPTTPNILLFKKVGGKTITIAQAKTISSRKSVEKPLLTFNRGSEGYVLTVIWDPVKKHGYQISQSNSK